MTYSPGLASAFNDTKMRSSLHSPQSGMCSFCTADCIGPCELGLSAVLGAQAVYPTNTGNNQVASEKEYPYDDSHFNIAGRVFGAMGAPADNDQTGIFSVGLERTIGRRHPVKLALPITLPALVKLRYLDYFAGAAMAGVTCVIGEGSPSKDPALTYENGKITHFPHLGEIFDSFRRYDRGYGQIILQCNCEDDKQGLPEYAILKQGGRAIEFKFGQSAKGTQPVQRLSGYEEALAKQQAGLLIHPDPSDPAIIKLHEQGCAPNFYHYGRLPMWDEEYLLRRIESLREMGLENVYFKMTGYTPEDIERVLRLASAAEVDMVTFDGAGGGSGYSPCKMMNEFGYPTVALEAIVVNIARKLHGEGLTLPAIAMTGGFASEDQVFKALAFGAPYVTAVGLCRAAMAAATTAHNIGEAVAKGETPAHLKKYGEGMEVFWELPNLRALYGKEADHFPAGAIGVFSYLQKIANGLRHFGGLTRKFDVSLFDRSDLIPLTAEARRLLDNRW